MSNLTSYSVTELSAPSPIIKLYEPSYLRSLKDLKVPRIFMLLQGYPGTGKTYSTVGTFPNPIVLDCDNKLGVHAGKELKVLPFHNAEWRKEYCKEARVNSQEYPHPYQLVHYYIQTEAIKLTTDQTLILDSWGVLQNWFDKVMNIPYFTDKGKEDGWKFWKLKKAFCRSIVEDLKMLSCNVVVNCHEVVDRDDDGKVIGLKPLVDGSYQDEFAGNFPFYFRQVVQTKEGKPQWMWQIQSDDKVKCICDKTGIPKDIKFVEAGYQFFLRDFTQPVAK